jgi:hypothetical protein
MNKANFERSTHSAVIRFSQNPEASSLIFCQACWVLPPLLEHTKRRQQLEFKKVGAIKSKCKETNQSNIEEDVISYQQISCTPS